MDIGACSLPSLLVTPAEAVICLFLLLSLVPLFSSFQRKRESSLCPSLLVIPAKAGNHFDLPVF
jgi:hypothetical protein